MLRELESLLACLNLGLRQQEEHIDVPGARESGTDVALRLSSLCGQSRPRTIMREASLRVKRKR